MIGNLKNNIEKLMQENGKTWDDVVWFGTLEECWPMKTKDILLDTEVDDTTDDIRSDFAVFGKDWRIFVVYTHVVSEDRFRGFEQNLRFEQYPKKPETVNKSPWLWRNKIPFENE